LQDVRAELASARERERIADQLHNLVIQRLFAAGLAATLAEPDAADMHLRSVQDGIVAALADLESAITTLHERVPVLDLLPDLAHLVYDAVEPHGITAAIENVGSVEYVPPDMSAEILAVAEHALSNVALHAEASNVGVTVAADGAEVWMRIADDGHGLGDEPPGKGMADMVSRAARLGGSCTWTANEPRGTIVDFRAPMPSRP
jgi:signal transduction histidine kinase